MALGHGARLRVSVCLGVAMRVAVGVATRVAVGVATRVAVGMARGIADASNFCTRKICPPDIPKVYVKHLLCAMHCSQF